MRNLCLLIIDSCLVFNFSNILAPGRSMNLIFSSGRDAANASQALCDINFSIAVIQFYFKLFSLIERNTEANLFTYSINTSSPVITTFSVDTEFPLF